MIAAIAYREFLASVLTYRFAMAFGACAVLMGLSAYALVDEYALRVEAHEVEVVRARAELDNIKVYAQLLEYQPFTHRPPSPLAIFGEGLEDRLGNVLHFSHGSVPTLLSASQNSNPLMHAFPVFDLATISALLLSLVALFFAYDSVSGNARPARSPCCSATPCRGRTCSSASGSGVWPAPACRLWPASESPSSWP